ncbi:hypothetical protein JRQ81_010448 [Phrynocephalus forsythii]|uniref:Phosphoglycolate phosphatase n=1 Tax=Phrynocephalus forsythii TaxID=171643 RepID=A0A9Q0XAK6_9SAUR|nr:hypothetical protein JRQ81_010448 [Phrynocephalus forsythii]
MGAAGAREAPWSRRREGESGGESVRRPILSLTERQRPPPSTLRAEMAKRGERLEPSRARSLLSGSEAWLFDCDGVLWRGESAVPGAAEALRRLEGEGKKRLCYVTNNSSRTRRAYTEKLRRLGFPPAEERQVFGSAYCAARFLRSALPPGGAAYVLGGAALSAELEAAGVAHLGAGPAPPPEDHAHFGASAPLDPRVRAVLVGYDQHFCYGKLCLALRYLLQEGGQEEGGGGGGGGPGGGGGGGRCLLVATNRDHRLPLEGGAAVPGTGCLVKAVETAAEREAFVVGKPSRYIFDCVVSEFHIDPSRTVMVGDRLDTDILMGNTCGLTTLLTLTGVTTLEEVQGHLESGCPERRSLVPDYYVDSIADLLPAFRD